MVRPIGTIIVILGIAGCSSANDGAATPAVSGTASTSPSASNRPASVTNTTSPSATPMRTPTTFPSPPPVPDGWQTFSDPNGLYALKYPPGWFTEPEGGSYVAIYPFDPAVTTPLANPNVIPGSVKIEVFREQMAPMSGCGSSELWDTTTGQLAVQPGAANWTLSGMPAYLFVYHEGEGEGGFTLAPSVTVIYKNYCFGIVAYFQDEKPDVQTFLEIVESFRLGF